MGVGGYKTIKYVDVEGGDWEWGRKGKLGAHAIKRVAPTPSTWCLLGEETAVKAAVVGSIVWAFRRLK